MEYAQIIDWAYTVVESDLFLVVPEKLQRDERYN